MIATYFKQTKTMLHVKNYKLEYPVAPSKCPFEY